jgi:hypothetical protein
MIRNDYGMPSELLDPREIERRYREIDSASARARLKIQDRLANHQMSAGRVKLIPNPPA